MDHHLVDGLLLQVFGIVAGVCILVGWGEQIYKGYRTKHLRDVSNYLMLFAGAGSALWALYGIFVSDAFIAGANLTATALVAIVTAMKKVYARREATAAS